MRITTTIAAVGLALAAAQPAAQAAALNARSFVSGHGNDANLCNYAAPCRTFAAAYARTNAGGEISVLDPAGYGQLTIGKALSIVNDGVGEASIVLIATGNAITINAEPTDPVSLRGLTLDGSGTPGTNGIVFNTGKSLTIQNCVIRHFGGDGIGFFPNAASNLTVSNTVASDNAGNGMVVHPTGSGDVSAVFNRVEANNNVFGLGLDGSNSTATAVQASVVDSVAAGSNGDGFFAFTAAGKAPTTLMLFHSVAANNVRGLSAAGPGAIIRAFQTMVTGNGDGWLLFLGGVVQSYGNNAIDGNAFSEGAPSSVVLK